MATKIYHLFKEELTAWTLAQKFVGLLAPGTYAGFDSIDASSNPATNTLVIGHGNSGISKAKADLTSSNAMGVVFTKQGYVVETDNVISVGSVPPNGSNYPRIDALIMEYQHQETTTPIGPVFTVAIGVAMNPLSALGTGNQIRKKVIVAWIWHKNNTTTYADSIIIPNCPLPSPLRAPYFANGIITDNQPLRERVIPIGAWDIEAISNTTVGTALSGITLEMITGVSGMIYNDARTKVYPLIFNPRSTTNPAAQADADSSNDNFFINSAEVSSGTLYITVQRKITGNKIPITGFTDANMNRGYLTIKYIDNTYMTGVEKVMGEMRRSNSANSKIPVDW